MRPLLLLVESNHSDAATRPAFRFRSFKASVWAPMDGFGIAVLSRLPIQRAPTVMRYSDHLERGWRKSVDEAEWQLEKDIAAKGTAIRGASITSHCRSRSPRNGSAGLDFVRRTTRAPPPLRRRPGMQSDREATHPAAVTLRRSKAGLWTAPESSSAARGPISSIHAYSMPSSDAKLLIDKPGSLT
jgi:hypothetical protein